jgi:acyl-CoA thioesterase FadM
MPVFKIHIDYIITRNDEEEIVTEGFTRHVFINKLTKKAVRIPDFFIEAIKPNYL